MAGNKKLKWYNDVTRNYKYKIGNGYYIHHYYKNIGRIRKGKNANIFSADFGALSTEFSKEKRSANLAIKTQYKELLLQPGFFSPQDIDLLNKIYDNKRGDEILDEINNSLVTSMQEGLDATKINSLLAIEKGTQTRLNSDMQVDLEDFFKHPEVERNCRALDIYIEQIAKGLKIIGGTHGKDLALALISIIGKEYNRENYGIALNKVVQDYADALEGTVVSDSISSRNSISKQRILNAANSIKTLGNALQKGVTNSDNKITNSSVKDIFEKNIISYFGELVASSVKTNGTLMVSKAVKDTLYTGLNKEDQVKLYLPNLQGSYKGVEGKDSPAYGKADLILQNMDLKVESLGTSINLSVGISNKLYKNNPGVDSNGKAGGEYHFGGGMNVKDAIEMSFANTRTKYLAYNTFAWQDKEELKYPLINLQDIIFSRSLINLIGARGKQDFASMLLLNGQFVPLWDLIKLATEKNSNLGYSKSMPEQHSPLAFHIDTTRKAGKKVDEQSRKRGLMKVSQLNNGEGLITEYQRGEGSQNYYAKVIKLMEHRANVIANGFGKAKISASLDLTKLNNLKT